MTTYEIKKISGGCIDFKTDGWHRMAIDTFCMMPEVAIAIYPGSYPDKEAYTLTQATSMSYLIEPIEGLAQALKTYIAPIVTEGVNILTGNKFTSIELQDGRTSYTEIHKGFEISAYVDHNGESNAGILSLCVKEMIHEVGGHACIDDALIDLQEAVQGWSSWNAPQTLGI
jgi:hypothetical protein